MGFSENRILYIDDEDINLLLFQEMFSKYYTVYLAKSTYQAEEIMNKVKFKVIVSDIHMPNETGLQFFNRLPKTENPPLFVILTAYVSDDLLLEALNQGRIFRYIGKPLVKEEVKSTIDKAIQQYDLQNETHNLYLQIIESQRNFYNIFQSSHDGIVILDSNETVLEANQAFEKSISVPVDSISGKKLPEIIPGNILEKVRSVISQLSGKNSSLTEFEYISRFDIKKIVELSTSSIDYKGENAILIIIRDITERRQNELKLMNAVVEAEERERSRIAKDLHDGLGPVMSTLKMYLEWLNKQDQVTSQTDILGLSLKSVNEAIITIKRISNNLSPHILEKFGLGAALNKYIDNIRKVSDIHFTLSSGINCRFELSTEMSVYRILTECITNTIRHGNASEIEISFNHTGKSLDFKYRDNGVGFVNADYTVGNTGQGLHNIQNRIKTMGGTITIQTSPGKGFFLKSEIPVI